MQFNRVPTNVQKHRKSISFMDIHVYNNQFFGDKHVIQTNADSVWNKEEKYRILCFEAGSSRGTLQRRIC